MTRGAASWLRMGTRPAHSPTHTCPPLAPSSQPQHRPRTIGPAACFEQERVRATAKRRRAPRSQQQPPLFRPTTQGCQFFVPCEHAWTGADDTRPVCVCEGLRAGRVGGTGLRFSWLSQRKRERRRTLNHENRNPVPPTRRKANGPSHTRDGHVPPPPFLSSSFVTSKSGMSPFPANFPPPQPSASPPASPHADPTNPYPGCTASAARSAGC